MVMAVRAVVRDRSLTGSVRPLTSAECYRSQPDDQWQRSSPQKIRWEPWRFINREAIG
jgi:hypothetical protein